MASRVDNLMFIQVISLTVLSLTETSDPFHEKTFLCHKYTYMRTKKTLSAYTSAQSDQRLYCSLYLDSTFIIPIE